MNITVTPQILIFLHFAVVTAIIAGIFTVLIKRRNGLHQSEMGRRPLFSEITGGRFGLVKFSWPFVRFSVYDDFLIISQWKKIILRFDEITGIEKGRFQLSSGIRIHHSRTDIPAKIIIRTSGADRIQSAIRGKVSFV